MKSSSYPVPKWVIFGWVGTAVILMLIGWTLLSGMLNQKQVLIAKEAEKLSSEAAIAVEMIDRQFIATRKSLELLADEAVVRIAKQSFGNEFNAYLSKITQMMPYLRTISILDQRGVGSHRIGWS